MINKKLLALGIAAGAISVQGAQTAEKPNIIVILVDDMGFSDLGCFGSEIQTPNLDSLAANGLRFSQFYNSARSCPTRASLLTGLHPHQAGMGWMAGTKYSNYGNDAYEGTINKSCVTMGEVLKSAGYFTAMSGKWHVGSIGPHLRGFDRSYEASAFYYLTDSEGTHSINIDGVATKNGGDADPANWYSSYKWAEWGNKYINEGISKQKPFFLYLAFNAPHFPIAAPDSVIKKYLGKYSDGWSELRRKRYARQKAIGLIDDKYVLTPDDDSWTAWNSLTAKQKAQQDSIMATYAACVDIMDQSVGRVIKNLKEKGVFDNTLIVFMSDNGGNAEGLTTGLGNNYATGPIGSAMSYLRCGGGWASAQNTPFKEYKHYIHEGGIHTSFIAHWPNGISDKGAIRTQMGHVMDIMPTIVEVSGASYPSTYNGNVITPMQGTSLVPAFNNLSLNRDTMVWEHEANRGIRIGHLKCVAKVAPVREFTIADHQRWELYDLSTDPTEMVNLASSQPAILQSMIATWERYANNKKFLPWPWGYYYSNVPGKHITFFNETFGKEGLPVSSYSASTIGVKTSVYNDFSQPGIAYTATNADKTTVISPSKASNIINASGASALLFGNSSATEKCIIKAVDTSEYDSVMLSYNLLKASGLGSNISVRVSTNQGSSWSTLANTGSVRTTDNWRNFIVSTFLPSAKSLWIELGVSTQYTLFDDISLRGIKKQPSGLNENVLSDKIIAYPNPCDQVVHLSSKSGADHVRLISPDGRVLLNQPLTSSLDISAISDGYYVLNIYNKNKISGHTGIVIKHK